MRQYRQDILRSIHIDTAGKKKRPKMGGKTTQDEKKRPKMKKTTQDEIMNPALKNMLKRDVVADKILKFCTVPRGMMEIAEHIGIREEECKKTCYPAVGAGTYGDDNAGKA